MAGEHWRDIQARTASHTEQSAAHDSHAGSFEAVVVAERGAPLEGEHVGGSWLGAMCRGHICAVVCGYLGEGVARAALGAVEVHKGGPRLGPLRDA